MKKQLFIVGILLVSILEVSAQFAPTTRNLDIASSPLFPDSEGGISGYIRGSAFGFRQDGGSAGSSNYDYSSTFAEAAVRADFKRSMTEGYLIFREEARMREG